MPPVQTIPVPHARPHIPQSPRLVMRSRHVPRQLVRPLPHDVWQWPIEQTSPLSHVVPHAPQFARSEAKSTHAVPQRFSPPGHTIAHVPATHD